MKNIMKKTTAVLMTFALLASVLSIPGRAEAKSSFWLSGVSRVAGGNMRMYYKGNTIVLKGKIRRSAARNKLANAPEKKCSYTLKVAGSCKVTLIEAQNNQTTTYKKWAKDKKWKKGTEVSCIAASFQVEGGKIKRIFFSA